MNYYNENDPYAAQWLRNLIAAGLIPEGVVDDRSIKDVAAEDLADFRQCHFFAGIGGWALALQLAGWDQSREVWTGSCPCQPFSVAGKQRGFGDDRDLWPVFAALIRERSPAVVFGEQVASSAPWISRMRSDLEEMDYAVGCCPIEAASAGAAQFRDRIWFVAVGASERWIPSTQTRVCGGEAGVGARDVEPERLRSEFRALAPERGKGLEELEGVAGDPGTQQSAVQRSGVQLLERAPGVGWGERWTEDEFRCRGFSAAVASLPDGTQFIGCPDGKFRRLPPPGVRWLGNGIQSRVAKLRGFGNAIYPPVAAEWIGAFLDCEGAI